MRLLYAFGCALLVAAVAAGCAKQPSGQGPSPGGGEAAQPAADIVETLAKDERFSTLMKAIDAAGMVEVLKGTGPFTVFAPTNEAFQKLPAGTLDELLKPENQEKLKELVGLHVVAQNLTGQEIDQLEPETPIQSYSAEFLNVKKEGGKVTVNGANVVQADIMAENGVIHAIDTVLTPPE